MVDFLWLIFLNIYIHNIHNHVITITFHSYTCIQQQKAVNRVWYRNR